MQAGKIYMILQEGLLTILSTRSPFRHQRIDPLGCPHRADGSLRPICRPDIGNHCNHCTNGTQEALTKQKQTTLDIKSNLIYQSSPPGAIHCFLKTRQTPDAADTLPPSWTYDILG